MKSKTKCVRVAVVGFFLLFYVFWTPWCRAGKKTNFKPLFPVGLNHDFPESKTTFEEVKNLIMQHYYSDEITEDALYWAAIQGMLRHISPPKAPELGKIWTAEEYEKIYMSRQGNQVSLGIKSTFNLNEGRLTVTEVLPNSPADSILKPFDHILRIDSQPL